MLELDVDELDRFVLQCKKGYNNTKERGMNQPNPRPFNVSIDLTDKMSDNALGLYYECFDRHKIRHFAFASFNSLWDRGIIALRKCEFNVVSYSRQQDLFRWISGTHDYFNPSNKSKKKEAIDTKNIAEMKQRRVSLWLSCNLPVYPLPAAGLGVSIFTISRYIPHYTR
jgi:hypothetical protein